MKPYILSSFTSDRTTEGHTSFGRITEVKLLHFVDNLISNEDKYYCFAGSENYLEKIRDFEGTNNKTLAIITATIMQILRAILACMKQLSVIPYSPEKLLLEVSIALLP